MKLSSHTAYASTAIVITVCLLNRSTFSLLAVQNNFCHFCRSLHCQTGLIFQFNCFAVESMMMFHLDIFGLLGRTTTKGFKTFQMSQFTMSWFSHSAWMNVWLYSLSHWKLFTRDMSQSLTVYAAACLSDFFVYYFVYIRVPAVPGLADQDDRNAVEKKRAYQLELLRQVCMHSVQRCQCIRCCITIVMKCCRHYFEVWVYGYASLDR